MTSTDLAISSPPTPEARSLSRELCSFRAEQAGPTLICVGSLHGNEPAGYQALERVREVLSQTTDDLALERGELVALTGNRSALVEGRRFLDHDLNRGWRSERIEEIRARSAQTAEEAEMIELADSIAAASSRARGPVVVLDLHTTSGESSPFISVADQSHHRELAMSFDTPLVLGIDHYLDSTLLEWINSQGSLGVIFEGGKHGAESSVDHNEAAVWVALEQLGLVEPEANPAAGERLREARRRLNRASRGLPSVLEIQYRHQIDQTSFTMVPGYRSFQEVFEGDLLAHQNGEEVRCRHSGTLLMPLYQPQGDDGFFVMRTLR